MAKSNIFTLENLSLYDSLLKQYINNTDAKAIKSAVIDGRTLKLFKAENPAEGATPDFTFTVPEQDLSGLQAAIEANTNAITAINDENTGILKTAKDYADTQVQGLADGAVKANADAIAKLDGADTVEGSVKAQIKAAKEALEQQITNSMYNDTEVRGLISANTTAVEAAQGEIDALEEVVAAMYTNEAIDTAVADAKKAGTDAQAAFEALDEVVSGMYTNTQIDEAIEAAKTAVAYDDSELRGLISDNADAIEAHKELVDGTVATLVGEDTGKSVRTIANEELVKQLVAEGAKESLDTLEEIAAWIQSHPEDASAMNKAIEDLETLVGTLPEGVTATTVVGYVAEAVAAEKSRAEGIEGGLETRLQAVEGAVGQGGSVDTQIDAKIAELDADVTSAEVEEGKGVRVQVVEADGKVTSVVVTGNYDNAYDAKGAAAAAETAANGYADGLNTAMDTRVTAIEGLVGEGFQPIPESEINALFA